MPDVTFVTAFINIYENPINNKDNTWRYTNFEKLAKSGIKICLYTDSKSYDDLNKLIENYPNVKMMKRMNLEDACFYKIIKPLEYTLPNSRNHIKDTEEYLFVQHSKIEFVNDAVYENPWNSTHFAWLDFSAAYNFSKLESTIESLYVLSKRIFRPKLLIFPGCWDSLEKDNVSEILETIHWRFCGTFFLGDAESIHEMFVLYKANFEEFVIENKKLMWEVNFWAWLEANTNWKPSWYSSDHNDRIIDIPTKYYALLLEPKLEKNIYDYPQMDEFLPSSPAYVKHNGKHILNTRYVNYSYSPGGAYMVRDENEKLRTRNLCSILGDDYFPVSHEEMSEEKIEFENHDSYSIGLEDIRLYEHNNTVKFIATNVNYIGKRGNRMIIGDYDTESYSFLNCKILQPPNHTSCEKNWVPLTIDNTECFIYKWCPFKLGKISEESNQLEIFSSDEIKSPDFHRIRGSTIFIDRGDDLVGIVHFCEETHPMRQYYHILVTLDKQTFKPVSYSDPFCFLHYGVEFCIGFSIENDKYLFWISKKDNDATMVSVNIDEIPIRHNILYPRNNE